MSGRPPVRWSSSVGSCIERSVIRLHIVNLPIGPVPGPPATMSPMPTTEDLTAGPLPWTARPGFRRTVADGRRCCTAAPPRPTPSRTAASRCAAGRAAAPLPHPWAPARVSVARRWPRRHAGDSDTVRLAAWFHDAVYRPDRSENEERSAALAVRALTAASLPAARWPRSSGCPAHRRPPPRARRPRRRGARDADLAVLGGALEAYAAYAAAVRAEYAFVPEPDFAPGARRSCDSCSAALPALYRTPAAHARFDAPARANPTAELDGL